MKSSLPASWRVSETNRFVVEDEQNNHVAFCADDKKLDLKKADKWADNARLISVAPDLLMFAKAVVCAADFKDKSSSFMEAMRLARLAIAHAAGEKFGECDACGQSVPADEISRCFAAGGVETFACDKCRNHNGGY